MYRAILCFLAFLVLGAAGCVGDDGLSPFGDDDDALAPDDDDDDATEVPDIEAASFAATLVGEAVASPGSNPETAIEGRFHILYWDDDDSAPTCRFDYEIEARALFETTLDAHCRACAGELAIEASGPRGFDGPDACEDLPGGVDLEFLLAADGNTEDLRSLLLVAASAVVHDDHELGRGLTTAGVAESYASAGFEVEYFVMVRADGWLGTEAGLGTIARSWSDSGHLPMFVIYRDRGEDEPSLRGTSYLAGLWTLAVGGPDLPADSR